MTPVLFAAPCPCLSGDPTGDLLDAVPEPNPNVQAQLQEGGAGASATKERFSGLFSNGKASHGWKFSLELDSRQRATNRNKFFHTGHVGLLGRD